MSDNLSAAESQALNRDISQLEALIEELLTYARLDRPQNELHLSEPDLPLWLSTHLADIQAVTPDKTVRIKTLVQGHYAALDMRWIICSITPCGTAIQRLKPACYCRGIERH